MDFLIIGQGICGTWLSYYLHKAGHSFLVIDNNKSNSASRIAAGIINPVTGRRIVKTWMIDELLPFIKAVYDELGEMLNIKAISQRNIIEFFPNPFMRESFLKRIKEDSSYLNLPDDPRKFDHEFNYEFGYGEIVPGYTVHLETLLPAWREFLVSNDLLMEEEFEVGQLKATEKDILYKNLKAENIIFCDGISSANSPWFSKLPFAFNKGEALVIETDGLSSEYIFKKGLMLAPLAEPGLFWAGANYLWDYENEDPTEKFRKETELLLKNWLKTGFKIIDHKASVRPANIERRPFVGMHPVQKNIGILNGMGAKGCSLASFFAKQLISHLDQNTAITPEADIKRFSKILSG